MGSEHAYNTAIRAMGEAIREQLGAAGRVEYCCAAGRHAKRTHVVILARVATDTTISGPYQEEERPQR